MLKIVLAESELEPVPEEIRRRRQFRNAFGDKDVVLLDSNFHHSAMKGLDDAYRRGRPDIVHVSLLNALESPLNKTGGLEFYIHTRNDQVIEMSPEWRVPRSYNRFVGLMEKLFETGKICHEETVLLKIKEMGLTDLIDDISEGMDVKLMHFQGGQYRPADNSVIIIGGFPHGDFSVDMDYPRYSIFDEELMAWSVVNHVIYSL
ncbi:MAG TPA: 16S rRNA methyltransferase [Candidatus Methanofastidiosa archaeon]|nr:16S rRNA methyltransferase [Candidatus Methanofastidiosa archaeon]HPR41353.1 16S rRNA methyltransferase [Candidatus Methanofastidiosa archaeon]